MQWNLPITKPQGTEFFFFYYKQIPSKMGTWSLDPQDSRSVGWHKRFPWETNFRYAWILFRRSFNILNIYRKFCGGTNHYDRPRWSRGSVLAFGTKVREFKPGQSRRIFKGEKILSTPSFGGKVKPSVPYRRFMACKRYLELRGSRILDEICQNISRPRRVPHSAARGLSRRWTWRHLAEKVETSKGGGKQWQLPLRTCPGCSVPEPYRSPDLVLVPAKPA